MGTYSAPSFADLDGDGDLDAVVGETGGTLRYFKNTGAGFELMVDVTAQNDAPVLANPIADQSSPANASGPSRSPANAFTDPDGAALTYTATLGNGDPLPDWLSLRRRHAAPSPARRRATSSALSSSR